MNIYVGNVSYDSSEEDLGNLFSEHGTVNSVKIIMNAPKYLVFDQMVEEYLVLVGSGCCGACFISFNNDFAKRTQHRTFLRIGYIYPGRRRI